MKGVLLLLVSWVPFVVSAMPQAAITGVEYLESGDPYSLKMPGQAVKAGDIVLITDERGSDEVRHARVKSVTDSGRAIVVVIDGPKAVEAPASPAVAVEPLTPAPAAASEPSADIAAALVKPVHDNFADASDALCEKQRACMMQQMHAEGGANPQMQQMMSQMMDGICASMRQGYGEANQVSHPLYQHVTACVSSMSQLSCSEMENSDQTPACMALDRQAQQFGG